MTVSEALKFFGSRRKIAEVLGLHVSAVYHWGDRLPPLREYQLKEIMQKAKAA